MNNASYNIEIPNTEIYITRIKKCKEINKSKKHTLKNGNLVNSDLIVEYLYQTHKSIVINKNNAKKIIFFIFEEIQSALKINKNITIPNFAKIESRWTINRKYRNPFTFEVYHKSSKKYYITNDFINQKGEINSDIFNTIAEKLSNKNYILNFNLAISLLNDLFNKIKLFLFEGKYVKIQFLGIFAIKTKRKVGNGKKTKPFKFLYFKASNSLDKEFINEKY